MRSVRVFYNFLERESLIQVNPMRRVEIPRAPDKHPKVLSVGEVQRLLRAAKRSTWYGTRNHSMIAMFLDTGLRLSELINLDLEDVDLNTMSVRVRNGKGGKQRTVFVGRTLARALRCWTERRPFANGIDAYFTT